jgi:hypothetical protein
MIKLPKIHNKPKKKFNFDNILSLNSDLDLSNNEEIDKWFKLVSSHTGMIYSPANEIEYAKLTQKFSNSCVNFWFNDDSQDFHFKVELDDECYIAGDAHEFMDKVSFYTKLFDTTDFIMWHSARELIDELKKINNGIKQYYIDKKKQDLLKDFQ